MPVGAGARRVVQGIPIDNPLLHLLALLLPGLSLGNHIDLLHFLDLVADRLTQ